MSKHRSAISRRRFIRLAAATGGIITASSRVWSSVDGNYSGKCLVTLQLDGGADVTQLCDPKINTPGEPKINNWADRADPGQAGNIMYAPVADNEWLFNRFGADMLVVNGVDAQTNSHETGRLFNWTGSNAEGKPSMSALHAAFNSPDQPLAYVVFGGTNRTSGIVGYNRFSDLEKLQSLGQPRYKTAERLMRSEEELGRVDFLVREDFSRLSAREFMNPRFRQSLARYDVARTNRDRFKALSDILPAPNELQGLELFQMGEYQVRDDLKAQMQGALLVFKSGLGSAADLAFHGFDTHENHDLRHEELFFRVADAIGFFWDYAEELGIAERIMLVIGSDFGRTNFYNDGNGKDHWPVGSYIIMEKNAPWGNRVVGVTDDLHFAQRIDPTTLKESRDGVLITPAHVHQAVQEYLGLDQYARDIGLSLPEVESLPLFDASLQTLGS